MRINHPIALVFTIALASLILLDGASDALLGQGRVTLTHGAASGEVTDHSALLWARADGPALIFFEIVKTGVGTAAGAPQRLIAGVDQSTDFIAKVELHNLEPDTLYFYRAWAERDGMRSETSFGRFRTAPLPDDPKGVTLIWSADLGGQGRCRQPEYSIFRAAAELKAQLFLLLGDSIYADNLCPSPPNLPGSELNAAEIGTLEAYRAKHRYNRADPAYQALLAKMPIYATWDDHEVLDNFAGTEETLTETGLQAFLEYYPIAPHPEDPNRIYRSFRWGRHLELFLLDTRQYRSPNTQPDGPEKTMLGSEQLAWLKERLIQSDATWKVIASSVPLSVIVSCPKACDSWSNGGSSTGFERELLEIVSFIEEEAIRNVVWLSGDVHFPQAVVYDPDGDGEWDFLEFSAGPLSATPGMPSTCLDETLKPKRFYAGYGFYNFGILRVNGDGSLELEVRDQENRLRFHQTFLPQLIFDGSQAAHFEAQSSIRHGLVGYWPFEEGAGEVTQDASGHGHLGLLRNGPKWTAGRIGRGLRFDGIDDEILIFCSEDFHIREGLTIALWAMLEADPDAGAGNDWRLLLGRKGFKPYGLLIEEDGLLNGSVYIAGKRQMIKSDKPLPIGEWVHAAFTYDGSTGLARLYLNGVIIKETIGAGGLFDLNERPLTISMHKDLHSWPGILDEIRLYNRALSPDEVKLLFRGASGGEKP